jgi:hypothetical protein
MERNARAGTPYELTPDSRLSKAPAILKSYEYAYPTAVLP